MANTLTNLIPELYESLDVVSRELVGFIPAVSMDNRIDRASVGEAVRIFQTPAATASNITPGVTAPNDGDQNIGSTTVTITKARGVPFRWNGEEQRGLNNGAGYGAVRNDQITQAMRTLCNEIEADLAGLYSTASRAFGTAGTTPFASDLTDAANMRKILVDNGCPDADLQMIINTTAGVKVRSMGQLSKVSEAGADTMLRQGVLLPLFNMDMRESAAVKTVTKGAGASYTTTAAGFAVGTTSIPLITGTGAINAGDVITFNGDTNKYVVATGIAAPGTIVLQAPGLLQAIPASATGVTVGNNFAANMVFHRSALVLATRAPALPQEGDMADDRTTIVDPRSGLAFEISMYKQYRQVRYEMAVAWGVANVKPQNTAILLG